MVGPDPFALSLSKGKLSTNGLSVRHWLREGHEKSRVEQRATRKHSVCHGRTGRINIEEHHDEEESLLLQTGP